MIKGRIEVSIVQLYLIVSHYLVLIQLLYSLAIRDYWSVGSESQKDDKYVVLVVDEFGGKGNILNFNVGEGVKFALPNVFWTRLTSKYGTVSSSSVHAKFLFFLEV